MTTKKALRCISLAITPAKGLCTFDIRISIQANRASPATMPAKGLCTFDNMQVREFSLPPNPAKLQDSRAAAFIQQYGPESWEVDALPPRVLQALVRTELEGLLDLELMQAIQDQEDQDREQLSTAAETL